MMQQKFSSQALFQGLNYRETGALVETTFVGAEPHYVIMDGDFKRHVAAVEIDRQVIGWIQQQAAANKELVSEQMMRMIGQDDLFTKAMIDSSISNMEQIIEQGLPDDARTMLGMVGFKIIVDVHGEVIDLTLPGQLSPDDDW
jgi:hypothetical protein